MRTKKWFTSPALLALLLSVAIAQSYPESSQRKGARVGHSGQEKPRSAVSDNWSGVTLRKLRVLTEQDGITVEITATRPVTPTLTTLTSPDRLVLDFPNTLSASHQNVVAVNHDGVKSVRIGVQPSDPPMTRLVVDLLQPRTSELVAIGDTIVLKLRSVPSAGEKAVVVDARTAIDPPIEIAAVSDLPFPHNEVDLNPPYLPGAAFKSPENRDHRSQSSPEVQESADPPRQTEDSSRNSSVAEGSGATASSGQEIGQQMPAVGKSPTPDNGKPEPQQAVNQVLPATGQGAEPSTPANGSNPAAAGEMKAAPTNQPLSNTTAGSPGVQEIADPPTQAQDSSRNSSATGGSGTTASSGQEVGQQMLAEQGGSGGKGVPQNDRDAMAWFAKAAANGDANAQWKLGLGYLKGIGVPQDERKAAEWFKTAANQGHIRAQSALSDLYFDGRVVPRDYIRAYTWASIAAGLRANDNDRLKVIGSRMTAVQIEEAHRRISSWWERQKLKPGNPVVPVSLVAVLADPAPRDAKDTKITTSQNAPATPPQAQQQATPGNQSSHTNTPPASGEQNAAAIIQHPANAPAQPDDESELAKPLTPDTKITSSQNAPVTPPQTVPQAQQQEQQQAMPGNQSSQSDTPTASSEQNAAATIQQPVNAPSQPNDQREPAKPSTLGGGSVSAVANSSLPAPVVAPPLNAADTAATVDRAKQQPSPDEYVIGEQDVLAITVWKEPLLSGSVVVRPDGKITIPLINEMRVAGLTPTQLQAALIERLKPFINVPQVTVAVRQINSRNVYLIGEAARSGVFPINSSTTILQLVAQAGGLKDFAKRKDIYVLRNEQGKQVRYRFNYEDVIRGKNNQQNIVLQPGDTVVVP
jgi:polysaccharide export outer membrane protein